MTDETHPDILEPNDLRVPERYRQLWYWEEGFETAKAWYHEEWDGSDIQLALAGDIAKVIQREAEKVRG